MKLIIILILFLTFTMLCCTIEPEAKTYCTKDYCMKEGQTLEQIGVR